MAVFIINPLKQTLAHYERELIETLEQSVDGHLEVIDTVAGDGVRGSLDRVKVALQAVYERLLMARGLREEVIVVIWPLFGYLEPLTLMRLARRNDVYIVVHDPSPLRRSYGGSKVAGSIFTAALRRGRFHIVYHTAVAQGVGIARTGIVGAVVPHPLSGETVDTSTCRAWDNNRRPTVRVLGQYKPARSLTALTTIAENAAGRYSLEIYGRGWPDVPGWSVAAEFVPENDFARLIMSSDCVVIPYHLFFQSGVAVRCLEAAVPVVAPRHEHIAQLYGSDWPGTVQDDSDWYSAVARVLSVERCHIEMRHRRAMHEVHDAWRTLLRQPN